MFHDKERKTKLKRMIFTDNRIIQQKDNSDNYDWLVVIWIILYICSRFILKLLFSLMVEVSNCKPVALTETRGTGGTPLDNAPDASLTHLTVAFLRNTLQGRNNQSLSQN